MIQKLPRPIAPRYISLALGSEPFKFAPTLNVAGEVIWQSATQGSMDQMEESRLMFLLQVFRLARPYVGGQKKIDKWVNISSGVSHIFRDLNPVYQMNSLNDGLPGGNWETDRTGKHYSIENYAMEEFQALFCAKANREKAAREIPAAILEFLNIEVVSGRCSPSNFEYLKPAYDKTNSKIGPITTDHMMKPLTAEQAKLLSAATKAHQHGSDPHTHPDEEESHASVQSLLEKFEHSAIDEEQRHFFQLMQFNGGSDAVWPSEDRELIMRFEDITWNRWDAAMRAPSPNWGLTRYWEIAHQQAHALNAFNTMSNLQNVQMLYRLPRLDAKGIPIIMKKCLEETQAQVLERLRKGVFI